MLKAMFREIQARLGDDYGLFQEFNPQVFKNEEYLEKYKNIGVLYLTNGNLGNLPDGALMQIEYSLDLFMRVDDSYVTSDLVTNDLVDLATGTTGIIMTEDGTATQFVLNTSLPTSDGAIRDGLGLHNYIVYQVNISVVFVKNVELAKTDDISITIGNTTYPLKSVLSVVEVPQTQLETVTFVNDGGENNPPMQNESIVLAYGWGLQIVKLYRSEDAPIRNAILNAPTAPVTVTYKGKTRQVIMHNCSFANELGQAVVFTINLSTAMRAV